MRFLMYMSVVSCLTTRLLSLCHNIDWLRKDNSSIGTWLFFVVYLERSFNEVNLFARITPT